MRIHNDVQTRIGNCETWEDLLSAVEGGLRDDGLSQTADHIKTARQQLETEDESEEDES